MARSPIGSASSITIYFQASVASEYSDIGRVPAFASSLGIRPRHSGSIRARQVFTGSWSARPRHHRRPPPAGTRLTMADRTHRWLFAVELATKRIN